MRTATVHPGTRTRPPAKPAGRRGGARHGTRGPHPLGLALLTLALAAAALPLRWAPGSVRVWRGYQTLLVRADRAGTDCARLIEAAFGPGVVDRRTATMEFWDFTGLARAPLEDLEERIDHSDPRYDGYMARAPGYFQARIGGKDWIVFYLPARETAPRVFPRLARVMGFSLGGTWRLIELDPMEKGLALLAFTGVAILLGHSRGKTRRREMGLTLAEALLWIPCIIMGGASAFALSLVLLFTWHPLMHVILAARGWDAHVLQGARPALTRFLVTAAAGCVLLLPASRLSFSPMAGYLGPLAASLLMPAGVVWLKGGTLKRKKRRTKFEPVAIVRTVKNKPSGRTIALLLALPTLLCIGCIPMMRGARLPASLPAAADFSWASLSRARTDAHLLPGYAELVTHEAFQETLAFGRPWRTPVQDERVYVPEYWISPATASIQARQRTVKVFDSTWLQSVRRRAEAGTLEALLFAQGRPVRAAQVSQAWLALIDVPALLAAAAVLFVLITRDRGVGPLIQGILLRLNRRARRNQAS